MKHNEWRSMGSPCILWSLALVAGYFRRMWDFNFRPSQQKVAAVVKKTFRCDSSGAPRGGMQALAVNPGISNNEIIGKGLAT